METHQKLSWRSITLFLFLSWLPFLCDLPWLLICFAFLKLAGRHEYIEILTVAPGRKKQLPFVVELEFRDQFEIAKASDEYKKLVAQLPEIYIGKAEYLRTLVRILCDAAKRFMEEKKIHMGPWRTRSFMEMKWSYSLERRSADESFNNNAISSRVHENCLQSSPAPIVVTT